MNQSHSDPHSAPVNQRRRLLRNVVQRTFPGLASSYRELRDYRQYLCLKPTPCSEGFYFNGDLDFEDSREEFGELTTFKDLLPTTDRVYDIGANAGFFSLVAARAGKPVVAVEPNFLNFQLLLLNLKENEIHSVEPLFCALSAVPGIERLFGGGQGASLKENWVGITSTYSRLVHCNTLDNIVQRHRGTDRILVKLDVEGAEFEVLKGAEQTLRRKAATEWIVEHMFDEGFDQYINPNFRALFELFWENGYTARTITETPRLVTPQDVESWIQDRRRGFGWMYYRFSRNSGNQQ